MCYNIYMKTYIIKVRDSSESVAFEKAKQILRHYPSAFAAIYGYHKDLERPVWLVDPILCKTYEDLKAQQVRINARRGQNRTTIYTLYQKDVEK